MTDTDTLADAPARRREIGRFLKDRRDRLRPADVGLPPGARRRVAGLRREEVASLAGVGVSWYTMLEHGSAEGVSAQTLAAVGRALRLTGDEVGYLERLAETRAVQAPGDRMRATTRGALAAIEWAPAYVCSSHWLVLGWRAMSLVWGIEPPGSAPFNIVERMFGDPALRAMHGDRFPAFANALVAMVRSATASHLENPAYRALCDRLMDDPLFAAAWNAYDVVLPLAPFATVVNSCAAGSFAYEAVTLELPGDDGHWLVVQVPDAASAARLRKLLR